MAKTSVHPIYVIAGKEQALAKKHYQTLLDRLIPAAERATGLWVTDSKAAIDEVLDELRTLPFLTGRRVVVVQEADEFITKYRPLLERYFDAPCASGVLILIANSFPSNTKLAKKLKTVGELVTITPPKPWELPAHITQYVKQTFDKALAREAAQLLVDLTGTDVTRLYSEVEKLVVFVDSKTNITVKDVEALVGHNRIFGVFEVIDAMVAGQTGVALSRLRNMFAEDKNAQFTTVGAFAFHFRKMFNAKAMLSQGRSVPEVTKALRIWGKTDQFYAQIRKVSLERISQFIQELASIDHQIKTGQTRAAVAIELLVLKA